MYEIETKILEVDVGFVKEKLSKLGAKKVQDTRLYVDWFRPKEHAEGETPWFLRIRTDKEGHSEITWKSKREFLGVSSTKKEINLKIEDPKGAADLFLEFGMNHYGHQEKDRISWLYQDWLLTWTNIPACPLILK